MILSILIFLAFIYLLIIKMMVNTLINVYQISYKEELINGKNSLSLRVKSVLLLLTMFCSFEYLKAQGWNTFETSLNVVDFELVILGLLNALLLGVIIALYNLSKHIVKSQSNDDAL